MGSAGFGLDWESWAINDANGANTKEVRRAFAFRLFMVWGGVEFSWEAAESWRNDKLIRNGKQCIQCIVHIVAMRFGNDMVTL